MNYSKGRHPYSLYILLALSLFSGAIFTVLGFDISKAILVLGLDVVLFSCFLLLTAFLIALKVPKSEHSFVENNTGSLFAWAIVLTFSVLPFILLQDHFTGNAIRLLINILLVAAGPCLALVLANSHSKTSRNILIIIIGYHAFYAAFFLCVVSFGIYEQPELESTFRLFPGYGNIRVIGQILPAILIAGVFFYGANQKTRSVLHTLIGLTVLSLIWSLLLWSGSRGGILAALFGFILIRITLKQLKGYFLATLIVPLAAGIALTFAYPQPQFGMGLERMYKKTFEAESAKDFSSKRTLIWSYTIENIKKHPVVGYGIDGFSEHALKKEWPIGHPHNVILSKAHSIGIIGAAALILWLAIYWIKTMWHLRKSTSIPFVSSTAGVTVFLTQSLYDGVLYHYQPMMLFIILFTISLHLYKAENST